MKIHCPETWCAVPGVDYGAPTISLKAILPVAGGRAYVGFTREDSLSQGDIATFLWQPPFSMLNGWGEQPTEIAQSYLVAARVIGVSRDSEQPPFSSRQYKHELEILSCDRLLPILQALHEDAECWKLAEIADMRTTPATIFLAWDEVSWCGTAAIDGLIYMVGNTSSESHMELIVDEVNGEFFGLFNAHLNPGGTSYDIGRRKLSEREQQAVRQAIHKAFRLVDSYGEYLAA